MEATSQQTRRTGTEEQTRKVPAEGLSNKEGKNPGDRFLSQHRSTTRPEEKEDTMPDPETPTGENNKVGHTLRKMAKIDKAFMKALLSLAAGAQDNEALLDKVLTEFKLKSITLEATHEVARLQGVLTSTQEKKTEQPTYAEKVKSQMQSNEPDEQITDYFDSREKGKRDGKLALIVTSETLGKE